MTKEALEVVCIVLIVTAFGLSAGPAGGDVTVTGDVDPFDPASWDSLTDVIVGDTADGAASAGENDTVATKHLYIGEDTGVTGTVNITGPNAQWTSGYGFHVGRYGIGHLNITDGGALISGVDHSNTWNYIGRYPGSTGHVTVSGNGSLLDCSANDNLQVGYQGDAEVSVLNGGRIITRPTIMNHATATVDGSGSNWTVTGNLVVEERVEDDSSGATLDITDEGTVTVDGTTTIGYQYARLGIVSVDGTGSTLTTASLVLGDQGAGVLSLSNGGQAVVAGTTTISLDYTGGGGGLVSLDGGMLTTGGLQCTTSELTGTGTINTTGLVSDIDLTFDSTHGLTQTLNLTGTDQDITINLNVDGTGPIGVGVRESASLTIADGVVVNSPSGMLGVHYYYGVGTATVSGEGSAWINGGTLTVGHSGEGHLTIENGADVSNTDALIGTNGRRGNLVLVDGEGSTWTSTGKVTIGHDIGGTLEITNGGRADCSSVEMGYASPDADGEIIVDGAGSTLNVEGNVRMDSAGRGSSVTVRDRGTITSGGGLSTGEYSSVTITGEGSTWTMAGEISWGSNGSLRNNETLTISDGGVLNSGQAAMDEVDILVSGTGSTWTASGRLIVGQTEDSRMDISNDGAVSNTSARIGDSSGSRGAVTVSGAGSTWTNSDDLSVGYYGAGTLNISDGGLVEVSGDTYVAPYGDSTGAINFDGGTLTSSGLLSSMSDLSGTGTVNSNGLVSDVDLVFDATHGLIQTLTLDGPDRDITVNLNVDGFGSMGAGYTGAGSTQISDGLIVQSTNGYLGFQAGSVGIVTVSGSDSTWTNSDRLWVGYRGDGTLEILNGGAVNNTNSKIAVSPGSTGAVTVSGVGSTWVNSDYLEVGSSGDGALDITNGGAVSNTSCHIGTYSTGAVTVSGAGSTWANSGELYVGYQGDGALNITNGGSVSNTECNIGRERDSTGEVTVSGAGSTWTNSDRLYVGWYGDGRVKVTDGAAVSNTSGYVGGKSGSSGAVTVSGGGSTWTNSSQLSVGYMARGTLVITNGAAVNSINGFIGNQPNSSGVVLVSGTGSTWTNSDDLYVGNYGPGELSIYDGGLVNVGSGLTTYGGNSFINMGSGGMLALAGDGDDSLGEFLGLISGSDAIRYWDESVWGWVHITGATPGVDYTLSYMDEGDLDGYTVLTVTAITADMLGDTNGDYIVDHEDLAIFNAQFGLRAPGMSCDFDGDDDVDLEDFRILRGHFGSGVVSAPDAEFAATTPEPATLILLAGGLPLLLRRRRRLLATDERG